MLRESDARLVCILTSSVSQRQGYPVSVWYRIVPDELGGRDLWMILIQGNAPSEDR